MVEDVLPSSFVPGAAHPGDPVETCTSFPAVYLTAEASAKLRDFASEHQLDPTSVVAAAWAVLLSRYRGEPAVAFQISESRTVELTLDEAQPLLGWLIQVRERMVSTSRKVPCATALAFDESGYSADLPLVVRVTTSPQVSIAATCQAHRFAEGAVPRLLRHAATILENMPAHAEGPISSLSLMRDAEWRDLVSGRNQTQVPYRESTSISQWFEEQAAQTPDQTAVIFRGTRLSYRELNEKSNRLAARLRDLGAAPDHVVALCAQRSLDMMVGLIGILKSGAAYLPIDPAFPRERMEFMLEDSGAAILITGDVAGTLPETSAHVVPIRSIWDSPAVEPLPAPTSGRNPAYVIYTSGSTGKPKGVIVEHRQVSNFFAAMDQVLGTKPGCWLAVTSISFDISVLELFWTLARGFTVVLQGESEKTGSGAEYSVAAQIRNHGITHLQCTPSMARLLASDPETLAAIGKLDKLILGGEALPAPLATQLRQAVHGEIFNLYGPTETTVWSAAYRVTRDEPVIPIGQPIANTQMYVLDAELRPTPYGVPGELFIGGDGVARGYHNRPELMPEKFLPDPFQPGPEHRLYRTGDLVRYRPDGELEFLGRIDNQVKILGFRIEPEEIEAVLGRHPGVQSIAVVVREDVPGEKRLAAYFVGAVTTVELRAYAQKMLPIHMVPAAFTAVESLPQTPNRKIDRRALAALPLFATASAEETVSSRGLEETVAGIFREALEVDAISTQGNFFDVGANSMILAQVAMALQEVLHREIPLTALFQYPTISSFTAYLRQAEAVSAPTQHRSKRAQLRFEALVGRQRPVRS